MEEDRGREGEGDVGDGVAIDSDVVGRRAGGHAVELNAAPVAVVAGEGEDGDFVEGGGEGGRGGGHGVGVAAAEAGVALDGLGLVAPLGEVAALGGRGGDGDLGAGQDAVGVVSLGGRYAVGVDEGSVGVVDRDCSYLNIVTTVVVATEGHRGGVDAGDVDGGVVVGGIRCAGGGVENAGIFFFVADGEHHAVDGLVAAGGDGGPAIILITKGQSIAVAWVVAGDGEVLAGVSGSSLVGGEALVAGGLRACGDAVQRHAAALVSGEGEQGVLGEGGGEVHAPADGDGVGVGGVVLGLAVVAPGADVVAVLGLGHDLHRGTGDDEVLAFGRAGHDAVAAAADEGYLFDISGAAFDDDLVSVTFPHGGVGVDGPALGVVPVGVVIIACESHLDAAEVAVLAGEGETT